MRPRRQRSAKETQRVVNSLPFVEQLARRVAATMPHSIDIGDLVQDGVIGLIDGRRIGPDVLDSVRDGVGQVGDVGEVNKVAIVSQRSSAIGAGGVHGYECNGVVVRVGPVGGEA